MVAMPALKILVTGGGSFIARSICPMMRGRGHIVDSYSRKEMDLCDLKMIKEKIGSDKYNVIIHTAADGGRRFDADNDSVLKNNLLSLENILSLRGRSRLIVFGSGSEYSNNGPPPAGSYALSKYIQTKRVYGLDGVLNLRIYGSYGKEGMNNGFVSTCFSLCENNQDIKIWEDKYFDFIFIDDLFEIIDEYLMSNRNSYLEEDACYSDKVRLSEIATMIKDITNSGSRICIDKSLGNDYIGRPRLDFSVLGALNRYAESIKK